MLRRPSGGKIESEEALSEALEDEAFIENLKNDYRELARLG